MACPAFVPEAYATSVVALIDCRVEALGQDGYLAMAASGSLVMIALGGLVTILIGLVGYRLLLGDPLEIRDGVLTVVRIGLVLALATQWPAYQALVYDVVLRGPGELSDTLAGAVGGTSADAPGRVQGVYDTLSSLAYPPLVVPAPASAAPTGSGTASVPAPLAKPLPATLTIEDQHRVSSAAVALLISSLAGIVSVRIVAAFLLALGPLFIACLLFRGLSGLFEGWVRGLAGAFLGSIAVTVVLATELAILEPQTLALLQALQARDVPKGAAGEILATTLLFGPVMLALLYAAARVGAGFRLPEAAAVMRQLPVLRPSAAAPDRTNGAAPDQRLTPAAVAPSRASQIVDSLRVSELRDSGLAAARPRRFLAPNDSARADSPRPPLGQSHKRTLQRRSAASGRRDQRS